MRILALTLLLTVIASAAGVAAPPEYRLEPRQIAPGVYLCEGPREDFSPANGGNILNTGFIVASEGVIVIDAGPSLRYAQALRAAIARVTDRPVRQLLLTHAHPDHFLGSLGFTDVPVVALAATARTIRERGSGMNASLYLKLGEWMIGTGLHPPTASADEGEIGIAGRRLRLIAGAGHTEGDLMVLDLATQTLFAGDLVFTQRAPTTPDADIETWLSSLDRIDAAGVAQLVPGHGPMMQPRAAVAQTRDYLIWLRELLRSSAERALDVPEVVRRKVPERFRTMAVFEAEFERSVANLYPRYEQQLLAPPAP